MAGLSKTNPPSAASTNFCDFRSNSLEISASDPPGERAISARSGVLSGPSSRRVDPCQTQVDAVSVVGGSRASRSRTVSHSGVEVLYDSRVVLRQTETLETKKRSK